MGRLAVVRRVVLLFLSAVTLVAVPVVATQSYLEYQTWQDRPLGVLDVLYGVLHSDLPRLPDWSCSHDHAPRLVDGHLAVRTLHQDGASPPLTDLQMEALLSERLGFPVTIEPSGSVGSLEEARATANAAPQTVFIVYHDGYFEGPDLHEKIEGLACNNLAITNAQGHCVEGIAAHEVGHVLGLGHSPGGLMRARAAPCDATLDADQTSMLLARSTHTPEPLLG